MTVQHSYDYWIDAVAGQAVDWPRNFAMPGFYRQQKRDGSKVGIAIWLSDNARPVVKVGKAAPRTLNTLSEEAEFCESTFAWITKTPVSEDAYRAWFASGTWPDEVTLPDRSNSEGAPHEVIEQSITDLKAQAETWLAEIGGEVKTQEQADKAGNYAGAFADLAKQAEDKRTDAKAPVLKQGREIDGLWNPIKAAGDKAKTWAKGLVEPFLKAERARKLDEAAKAAAAGESVRTEDTKVKAGSRGRSVSLRKHDEARVTDMAALIEHYRNDERFWKRGIVCAELGAQAMLDTRAGGTVPGFKIEPVESAA